MELVSPGIGLIFWMTLSFGIVLFILGKFAWKPILKSLRDREDSIDEALNTANKAREDMKQLKFDNEALLKEAKGERDAILHDARDIKDTIIEESKIKANEEANRIIEAAKETIQHEKLAAITDLKNQVAVLSIEIAEKILKAELSEDKKQKQYVQKLIDEVKIN
jgi:F-type H+-transporting ATPase subunit b